MNLIDFLIILVLAAWCGYVLYMKKKGKIKGCGGGCESCGSASLCHLDFKKIQKEIKEDQA